MDINSIISNIINKNQPYTEKTPIRLAAYELLNILDELAMMSATHPTIRTFWSWFAKNYANGAINRISDEELKKRLKRSYDLIKPIFEKVDTAVSLSEAKLLNDPEQIKKLMKLPDFADAMTLVEGMV